MLGQEVGEVVHAAVHNGPAVVNRLVLGDLLLGEYDGRTGLDVGAPKVSASLVVEVRVVRDVVGRDDGGGAGGDTLLCVPILAGRFGGVAILGESHCSFVDEAWLHVERPRRGVGEEGIVAARSLPIELLVLLADIVRGRDAEREEVDGFHLLFFACFFCCCCCCCFLSHKSSAWMDAMFRRVGGFL